MLFSLYTASIFIGVSFFCLFTNALLLNRCCRWSTSTTIIRSNVVRSHTIALAAKEEPAKTKKQSSKAATTSNLKVAMGKSTKVKSKTIDKTIATTKAPTTRTSGVNADERDEMMREIVGQLMERLDGGSTDEELQDNSEQEQRDILNGIVRIYCTHSQPNFGMPWQRMKQDFSSSTGFVINGNRILTNAHAVEYGSLIQVKKRQSEKKYVASVLAVGHECDLALLKVEDPSFWTDLEPLEFGNIPDLQEDVTVIGYPVGGDSISISSGVVSRIEMQEYAQASAELLAIQIDAAINPGNSGGPVVDSSNKVIGVAFQSLSEEDIENIGYVVPVNVIHHFLDDVQRHGSYSGVCGLGVRLQPMENDQLRSFFGMHENDTGVLVLSTAPTAPATALLQKGDVVLEVDSIRVANDGTIPFREGAFKERVQLSYFFTQRFATDSVRLTILRAGQRLEVTVPLWVPQRLVPRTLLQKNYIDAATNAGTGSGGSIVGGVPSYLMVGGLVMLALSKEYIDDEFHLDHMQDVVGWAQEFKILSLADTMQQEADEEVVLLSQVIAHNCNIGYEMYKNLHLKAFNSVKVKNLRHLKTLLDTLEADTTINNSSDSSITSSSANAKKTSKSSRSKTSAITSTSSSGEPIKPVVSVDGDQSSKKPLLPSMVFEFTNGQIIVLDGSQAFRAQAQICKEHSIPQSFQL